MFLFSSASSVVQTVLALAFAIMGELLKSVIMSLDVSYKKELGICWCFFLGFMSETFVALLFPEVNSL